VLDIGRGGIAAARQQARDVLIIDTAGRTSIDQPLLDEIRQLAAALQPSETMLVVDAMVGQESVAVAQAFAEATPVSGLVLTKIDGDARGGAALSIGAVTGLPVKFLGTGERTDALEVFHPDRLAGRILGMGDVMTLIERAQENVDQKQAEELARKLQRNAFTLEDFLDQMQQIKKMGPIGGLLEMIPGMGGAAREAQQAVDRGELTRVEAIIQSMTLAERRDPDLLNGSRRRRVARGSGTSLQDVNRLIKQFTEMKKLMKQFSGAGGKRALAGLPFGPRR
jgi:signal recognition particle subunit SRP54